VKKFVDSEPQDVAVDIAMREMRQCFARRQFARRDRLRAQAYLAPVASQNSRRRLSISVSPSSVQYVLTSSSGESVKHQPQRAFAGDSAAPYVENP